MEIILAEISADVVVKDNVERVIDGRRLCHALPLALKGWRNSAFQHPLKSTLPMKKMAGQTIRKCTPVKRHLKTRTFPLDFSRSGRRDARDNLRILILIRPNSLIRESDALASYPSFSAGWLRSSASPVIFPAYAFSRFRAFYLSLLIEIKEERRIKSDEKRQNTHPRVGRVYTKSARRLAMWITPDLRGLADSKPLNFHICFSKKPLIRASAGAPPLGGYVDFAPCIEVQKYE